MAVSVQSPCVPGISPSPACLPPLSPRLWPARLCQTPANTTLITPCSRLFSWKPVVAQQVLLFYVTGDFPILPLPGRVVNSGSVLGLTPTFHLLSSACCRPSEPCRPGAVQGGPWDLPEASCWGPGPASGFTGPVLRCRGAEGGQGSANSPTAGGRAVLSQAITTCSVWGPREVTQRRERGPGSWRQKRSPGSEARRARRCRRSSYSGGAAFRGVELQIQGLT